MNSAYFLIPGLRLPKEVLKEPSLGADFSSLLQLGEGAEEVIEQELVHETVLDGAAHIAWLWQVIAKRGGMPETAAFEWEADGGPAMGAETWRLHTVHDETINGQTILRSPKEELSAEERDVLHDEVLACVRQFGFQLQQWADRWYLTRNQDWNLVVRPWCAQKYRPFSTDSLSGADEQAFIALDEKLRAILKKSDVNAKRLAQGMETIDGFWPDGGSRRHLLKPSTIRAVMANDSYVWGWAQKLPGVIKPVTHLADLAHASRATRLVLVASGARDTHTVVIDKNVTKSLFARFKKKKTLNLENFLGETGL